MKQKALVLAAFIVVGGIAVYQYAASRAEIRAAHEMQDRLERLTSAVEILTDKLDLLIQRQMRHMDAGTFHAEWVFQGASGPEKHEVNLTRESGESDADWRARIAATMAREMAAYPPI